MHAAPEQGHGASNGAGAAPEHCRAGCPASWGACPGWPPCHGEGPDRDPAGEMLPSAAWSDQGLAVCTLELAKFLAELGKTTFRASGTCMYPGVRPGDLLRIEPKNVREIAVGEIAVFRRAGSLFAHRTIAREEDARGPYILTRPDRAGSGNDGPSYEEDLVGIVSRIERGNRVLSPVRSVLTWWQQAYFSCCLRLIEAKQAVIARLLGWFGAVQRTGPYCLAARFWFARVDRALDIAVMAPLHSSSAPSFSQKYSGLEIDTFILTRDNQDLSQWTIILRVGRQPAASLAFYRCPDGCPHAGWWLSGAHTRIRYRGMGLEEILFRKAVGILARSAVPNLRMVVPKGSPEVHAWRRLGFTVQQDILSRESALALGHPAGRIILEAAIR